MAQLALGSLSVMQKSLFKRAEVSVFVGWVEMLFIYLRIKIIT